jgi:hypothetical protein
MIATDNIEGNVVFDQAFLGQQFGFNGRVLKACSIKYQKVKIYCLFFLNTTTEE